MGHGVWNGPNFVHGIWNTCQKFDENVREGKLGITTPFDVIASDVCSEQETKTENKLTHTRLNKSIPHENLDFILFDIHLLVSATGRVFEEVEQ
jgi:hypothetical protein